MIRINKKTSLALPDILSTTGVALTTALINRYDAGERNFGSTDFSSTIYGNKDVKNVLIESQDYKCCFCESKIGHISYGDVEHFRPKAGWVQDSEKMNVPGYYWLAYDWDNLLLSCQLCNQRYKKNLFPLVNPGHRALSHNDNILAEDPVFIHPAVDNPEDYITFKDEIPVTMNNNTRGYVTIKKLGLDRELLNEQRRKTLNLVRDIYNLSKGMPETPKELKDDARKTITKYFESSKKDETEYASMLRSFFRDNPIDF